MSQTEIELGHLALERTQDAKVRRYAQQIVRDNPAQTHKLKKLALQ